MGKKEKFWPFGPKTSLGLTFLFLIILLGLFSLINNILNWSFPQPGVLIGIVVLSLLPVIFSILNAIMETGGSIGYGDLKIDFAKVQQTGKQDFTLPVNIGVRGQPVADSGTEQIIDCLKQATTVDIIVIDLEEGQAWWETRLLVLLSGANRLQKPGKIVFTGTQGGKEQCFLGWGRSDELLRCLLDADPQYKRYYFIARAAARQWELVEPLVPVPPAQAAPIPPMPAFLHGLLATSHTWMAFDHNTGLPNEFLAEQLLQSKLGQEIEQKAGSVKISISRLEEIFNPVLNKDAIDQQWKAEEQLNVFFKTESAFIALSNYGKYTALVSRIAVLNEMLSTLMLKKKDEK